MKLIFSPVDTVWKVCGEEKYKPDQSYKLSSYCVSTDCDDGTLLYNTLTGAMFLIDKDETVEDNIEQMVKYRFCVPTDFNEIEFADGIREILSYMSFDNSVTSFKVLTTTDCNARCFYCYQAGCKHITMSDKTAVDVADYIARVSGENAVNLGWFGGEPLYNLNAIDIICDRLKELGCAYKSKMITNGYLFTPEVIKRAVQNWNLREVVITIDGTKEVYNSIKAYINKDDNAFERVLDNIEELSENGIKTIIRLNMDSNNYHDLLKLCDILGKRFRDNKNVFAHPALLKEFIGSIGHFSSDREQIDAYIFILNKLKDEGLDITSKLSRGITLNRCIADSDRGEVIMPDGSLEKCEHFSDKDRIGTIYSSERDHEIIASWKERIVYPECSDCALYPKCYELKKCAWSSDGCSSRVRELRLYKLKRRILKAYLDEKAKS